MPNMYNIIGMIMYDPETTSCDIWAFVAERVDGFVVKPLDELGPWTERFSKRFSQVIQLDLQSPSLDYTQLVGGLEHFLFFHILGIR